jgi:hypothetical protein
MANTKGALAHFASGGSTYSLSDPKYGWTDVSSSPNWQEWLGSAFPKDQAEADIYHALGIQMPDATARTGPDSDIGRFQYDTSGLPDLYRGYDPSSGQQIWSAFDRNGSQVGTPHTWTDSGFDPLSALILGAGAGITGAGLMGYLPGGAAAAGAEGVGGIGTLSASELPAVASPAIDANLIAGTGSLADLGGAGTIGAGLGGGGSLYGSLGSSAAGGPLDLASSSNAFAGSGIAGTAADPLEAAMAGGGASYNVPGLFEGASQGGGLMDRLGNGLSNWWDKASSGDLNAIRSGLSTIGALSQLFGAHNPNNLSASQIRDQLKGPYNSFSPSQQAAVSHYFNSPVSVQYRAPNVNGIVQLSNQTGSPSAQTWLPPNTANTMPVQQGPQGYAHGGSVCGALSHFAKGGSAYVQGNAPGQADNVPAVLSPGEYVMDADTVSSLGDGNNAAGAQKLDQMRQSIREHKRSAPADKIPPKAKAPEQYLKGRK